DRPRARRGGGVAAPARPGGRGRAPLLAARDPLSDAGLLHVPRGAGGARARAAAAPAAAARGRARAPASRGPVGRRELPPREHLVGLDPLLLALEGHPAEVPRSEERRVGKVSRCGLS